jgi:hypothetical protein
LTGTNKIQFRKLKETEVNLLCEIWQIGYVEQAQATPALLATRLGVSKNGLATTLSRLRDISEGHDEQYVLSEGSDEGGVYYILAGDNLVTYKETAKILELILDFPQNLRDQSRVPYQDFLNRTSVALGLPTTDIQGIIDKARQQQYLELVELNGTWIVEKARLKYEKEYIRHIAAKFVPKRKPKTKKKSARK